ncbi:hypothetical protein CMV_018725, partial [Castanea mollissima]
VVVVWVWIGGSGWPVLTTSAIGGGSDVAGGDGWPAQTSPTKRSGPQRRRAGASGLDSGAGGVWKKAGSTSFRHSSPLQRKSRSREPTNVDVNVSGGGDGAGGGGPSAVNFTDRQYLNIAVNGTVCTYIACSFIGLSVIWIDGVFIGIENLGLTLGCDSEIGNRTAENLYGYSAAEALGQDAIELLIDPQNYAVANNIVHRVSMGNKLGLDPQQPLQSAIA